MSGPLSKVLATVARVRRIETDTARRALAIALAREADLARRAAGAEGALAAARTMTEPFDQQTFSAYVSRVTQERSRLLAASKAAETETDLARAALAARRMAETVASEALAGARRSEDHALSQRTQTALEDAARGRPRGHRVK